MKSVLTIFSTLQSSLQRIMNDNRNSEKPASTKRRARRLVDESEIESEYGLPHIPMSTHIHQTDLDDNSDEERKSENAKLGLRGDYGNIALLMFLYVLQGIPLGLSGSVPMLLQSRKVSYKDQAVFSFVFWPFSIKLLWAPLVDSLYLNSFGRRKTWLVPIQYLIGVFMMVLSLEADSLIGTEADKDTGVNIYGLTCIFFMLNFLAATQDIAVDGWALTMLSRRNVGWASTCNTVGQTAGYFLGNVLFLALESADFCNKYLRSEPQDTGVVTLASFLYFWGIVFFVSTTLVWLFKKERDDSADDQGIMDTYKQLWNVVRLPAVISYAIIILTAKVGFAATDSVTGLKLLEAGIPKQTLALLAVPMIPIQIILPLVISRYTSGPRPMNIFLKAMPPRLLFGFWYAFIVWLSFQIKSSQGEFTSSFYVLVVLSYAVHQVFVYCMFVAQMAFHAKISDPAIGGTYMTLLNTLANLGGNWPGTVVLWFVDGLTWKSCEGAVGSCSSSELEKQCTEAGGSCSTFLDGFYMETCVCIAIGFLWLLWRKRKLQQLESLPLSSWQCS